MVYPASCQRLSIDGVSIESGALNLVAWTGFMGMPGRRGPPVRLPTVDRAFQFDYPPWDTRMVSLAVYAADRDEDLQITDPNGRVGHLETNIDTLLGLFLGARSTGLVKLDREMADGSERFIQFRVTTASPMGPGPFFGSTVAAYQIVVVGEAPHPFWQSQTATTEGVNSFTYPSFPDVTAPLINPVFDFSGSSTVENPANGDTITTTGACTVSLATRAITSGGSPADNLVSANRAHWMRVMPGDTLTNTGSACDITWRSQWI